MVAILRALVGSVGGGGRGGRLGALSGGGGSSLGALLLRRLRLSVGDGRVGDDGGGHCGCNEASKVGEVAHEVCGLAIAPGTRGDK